MDEQELPINFLFECKNPNYMVVVRQYMFNQFRLQLLKGAVTRPTVNLGEIHRECCTYDRMTAIEFRDNICMADNPEAYLESIVTPLNCEFKGGRIRLDNKERV